MKKIILIDGELNSAGKAALASLNTEYILRTLENDGKGKPIMLPLNEPAHYIICGPSLGQLYLKDNSDFRRVEYHQSFSTYSIKVWHVEHPNSFKAFTTDIEALRKPDRFIAMNIDAFSDVEDPTSPLALDLETTKFNPYRKGAQILSVSMSQRNMGQLESWAGTFEEWLNWYEDNKESFLKREILGQNIKFDLKWFKAFGVEDLDKWYISDTMIVENLYNENVKKGLDDLILRYTKFPNFWRKFNYDYYCSGKPLSIADLKALYTYNMYDTAATLMVYEKQIAPQDNLMDFEMDKLKLLLNIEAAGMKVDEVLLKKKIGSAKRKQTALLKKIKEHAAELGYEDFNIDSPIQLRTMLYETKGYDVVGYTKTGQPSTDGDTINTLLAKYPEDTLLQNITETKFLGKMLSTYYNNIKEQLEENGNGFIRCNYNQAVADTFRLSSSEPNFQNLPSRNKDAVKPLFISRYPEGIIVEVDYSQAELRMLADLSGDVNMLKAFNDGLDFHEATAQGLGVSRDVAKTANFRIVYGGGSREEKEAWFKFYSGAERYITDCHKEWYNTGKVKSLLGHTRHLGAVPVAWGAKCHKERQAANFPIQCIAAQLTIIALMLTEKYLKDNKIEAHICNTVHDSGILDFKTLNVEQLQDIKNIWKEGVKDWVLKYTGHEIKVELKADVTYGPNWGQQEEEL